MDDAEKMALYGPCAACGAPREPNRVEDDEGNVRLGLVCSKSPDHEPLGGA